MLTSEEARQQAQAERLTLLVADNTTGYFGVYLNNKPGQLKPYQVRRGGKMVGLGSFATAEEAALCVARSPEGQAAADKAAAAPLPTPPLTSEEARQQAQAEGLTLLVAESKAGYFGVIRRTHTGTKPYQARVRRNGKVEALGRFATAEAALCVARSPEGQAAAEQAASAGGISKASLPAMLSGVIMKEDAQEEGVILPMPPGTFVKKEMVSPMPSDAFVKQEVASSRRRRARAVGRSGRERRDGVYTRLQGVLYFCSSRSPTRVAQGVLFLLVLLAPRQILQVCSSTGAQTAHDHSTASPSLLCQRLVPPRSSSSRPLETCTAACGRTRPRRTVSPPHPHPHPRDRGRSEDHRRPTTRHRTPSRTPRFHCRRTAACASPASCDSVVARARPQPGRPRPARCWTSIVIKRHCTFTGTFPPTLICHAARNFPPPSTPLFPFLFI